MPNELIWFLMLLANFACIIAIYYFFGLTGLFCWIPIATILANIQVTMLVELFGFTTTLGNVLYAGSFLVTDIMSENYTKKDAVRAVKIGFFAMIATTVIMSCAIHMAPSATEGGGISFEGVRNIFAFMPRVSFASLVAYAVSQTHDIWSYFRWRSWFPAKKFMFIRNNMSTLVSQAIDNVIFTAVAFWGVYPFEVLVQIFWSTYLLKFIIALCDTPFLYLADYLKQSGRIRNDVERPN
ncbi:MAG: queuosine precursor transporter [Fusobacteriaceae bacterium]|jgi:uncharacterized integral membrane protein (TIGR00697 family)|nr:queuosine precursor transporter [Fusobacteriaceae bacterium]